MASRDDADILMHTPERVNFYRLTTLLIVGGTEIMRQEFDRIHPPRTLTADLAAVRSTIQRAARLTRTQMDLLYPPPGNPVRSRNFDITLLFALLRHICHLPEPATGWNALPPESDESLQADLARIKFYRNELYAHASGRMEVSADEFNQLWRVISLALLRIVGINDAHKMIQWKRHIDELYNEPLQAPESLDLCLQNLRQWHEAEMDEIRRSISNIELKAGASIASLEQKLDTIIDDTTETRNSVDRLHEIVASETFRSAGTSNVHYGDVFNQPVNIINFNSSNPEALQSVLDSSSRRPYLLRETPPTGEYSNLPLRSSTRSTGSDGSLPLNSNSLEDARSSGMSFSYPSSEASESYGIPSLLSDATCPTAFQGSESPVRYSRSQNTDDAARQHEPVFHSTPIGHNSATMADQNQTQNGVNLDQSGLENTGRRLTHRIRSVEHFTGEGRKRRALHTSFIDCTPAANSSSKQTKSMPDITTGSSTTTAARDLYIIVCQNGGSMKLQLALRQLRVVSEESYATVMLGEQNFFKKHSDLFCMQPNGEVVDAVCQVKFCKKICYPDGCTSQCLDLHLCPFNLMGKCKRKSSNCKRSHDSNDQHTLLILGKGFGLGRLLADQRLRLLQKLASDKESQWKTPCSPVPIVCKFYKKGKCQPRGDKCECLHVCGFWVENRDCRFGDRCIKDHNFESQHNKGILERDGLHCLEDWEVLERLQRGK